MDISKVYVASEGCFIVQQETNHMAAYLKENGYDLVETAKEAEAIIVTTCAVTDAAAETTYQGIVRRIGERKDNVPVYVVGCYSRIEKERMNKLFEHGNIRIVPEIKDMEKEFLGAKPWDSIVYNNFFSHPFGQQYLEKAREDSSLKFRLFKNSFRYLDTVFNKETLFHFLFSAGHLCNPEVQRAIWPLMCSKGCTHACTYCAVRIGRGRYTSKPMDSILKEVTWGIDRGYNKILLIGDELGPYGVDLKDGTNLSKLLEAFLSDEYPVSIGLWYLDAFHLLEVESAVERLAQAGKIFFLGITLQHGSKRILDLMNRHYSTEDTMEVVMRMRRFPGIILATQIMVGFPTETEEDFLESLALVEKGCFDKVEVFEYSPRPGTRAEKMTDDVPAEVKRDRAMRLRKLADRKAKRLFAKHVIHQFVPNSTNSSGGRGNSVDP